MTEMIPAATVVLLRDVPSFQVLMIERHKAVGFAGGALVFPGGRIDENDSDPDWANYCAAGDIDSARIAAIRESFEEAGILLAYRRNGCDFVDDEIVASLNLERKAVEQDAAKFLDMIKREGLVLAVDALVDFAHWRPPVNASHRSYDTRFFAAIAPQNQVAREDGHEATEAIWIAPQNALDAVECGDRFMIFPTKRNVELLGVSNTAQGVIDFAQKRKIECVIPEVAMRGGKPSLIIPDDLGYPVTEEPVETAFRS